MPKECERLNFTNDSLNNSLGKYESKCLKRKPNFITKYDETAVIFKTIWENSHYKLTLSSNVLLGFILFPGSVQFRRLSN